MVKTFNGTGGDDAFFEPQFNGSETEHVFNGGAGFDVVNFLNQVTLYDLIWENGRLVELRSGGGPDEGPPQSFKLNGIEQLNFSHFSLSTTEPTLFDLGLDNPLTLPMEGIPGGFAIADFTGDGLDDVIITQTYDPPDFSAPAAGLLLLQNRGDGTVVDATSQFIVGNPTYNISRVAVTADFNGDGRPDFFAAVTGPDVFPFSGDNDVLLLSGPDGKLHDATSTLPDIVAFSHDAVVGDIENDGDLDIFVSVVAGFEGDFLKSYFLINDGTGRFDFRPHPVEGGLPAPNDFLNGSLHSAAAFGDFNGDGFLDLVLDGNESDPNEKTQLYFNDGAGNFPEADKIILPDGVIGPGNGATLDILVTDLDGDGTEDIVLLQTASGVIGTGFGMQALINQGDGTFVDDSAARFGYVDPDGIAPYRMTFIDFNRDGHDDILLYGAKSSDAEYDLNGLTTVQPILFLNDGTGHFDGVTNAFLGATSMNYIPFGAGANGFDFLHSTKEIIGARTDIANEMTFFVADALAPYGTGPDGMNPATVGAAGFNEFYYLRHNPAAQSAVNAGQFATGLAHYLSVGRQSGLQPAAPMLETSALSDVAYGLAGADTIAAGAGDDQMYAFAGNDSLWGQDGNDTLFGGDGADRLFGNKNNDVLGGENGNDEMKGHVGDDVLDGGAGNDVGFGGGNNDSVDGGAGDDTMGGNSGADTVSGGDGNDAVRGQGGPDMLFGGAGADTLVGHQGFDTLDGGDGNDLLIGAQANDRLIGGNGADTFVFVDDGGFDTIVDFEDGTDIIAIADVNAFGALDIVDTPEGAEIRFGETTVLVAGTAASALGAADFVLG